MWGYGPCGGTDHASLQGGLQVDTTAVLDEECNLTLVICTFQIDMARNEVGAAAAGLVLQAFVNL